MEHQQFALRFKSADIANEFKSLVDRLTKEVAALDLSAAAIETPPSSPTPPIQVQSPVVSSSSSECVVVDEVLPEEDLVALAEKYMLPKSFYNYMKKPPCSGCAGCEDEMVVSSTTKVEAKVTEDVTPKEGMLQDGYDIQKLLTNFSLLIVLSTR